MAGMHPSMPGQQALKDIPHNNDYRYPQTRANKNTANNLLRVCGHIAAVETRKEGKGYEG